MKKTNSRRPTSAKALSVKKERKDGQRDLLHLSNLITDYLACH
jgi:hypothetical protein